MTAAPEPASVILLGIGAICLLGCGCGKRVLAFWRIVYSRCRPAGQEARRAA